jgi:hypothetical protein
MAGPAPGTWTAATATSSCCPAPTCSTGGASASSGGCSPRGAPDDYLHAYFEPTARAIDGLEKALARTLEEKLQAARSSNRFAGRRIAQLEAELASQPSTVSHPTC